MSDIVTTSGRSIHTVTAEIVAISNQAAQMAYMSMIEIGKRLVEAKEMVDHGEWGAYLKNEVKFSQRTANNFMQIYTRSLSGSNSQTFANLGYSQIVKLLALPDEEVAELARDHNLEDMSVRQLEQAIRERDAAKEAQAAAEKKLLDAQQKAGAAEKAESAQKQEVKKLQAAKSKAESEAAEAKKALEAAQGKEQAIRDAVTAEYQKKLDQAEAAVRDANAKLESAKKSSKLSDQDMASINALGQQVLTTWNAIQGHRLKAVAANPKNQASVDKFLRKILDIMERALSNGMPEGGGGNDGMASKA